MPKIVVKGWRVFGVPDDATGEKSQPVALSRKYDVREAADEFAAMVRSTCKWPDTVYVKAITGFDGIAGDI
jgi:hypothetical protein